MLSFPSTTNRRKNVLVNTVAETNVREILKNGLLTLRDSTIQQGLGVLRSSLFSTDFSNRASIDTDRIKYDAPHNPETEVKRTRFQDTDVTPVPSYNKYAAMKPDKNLGKDPDKNLIKGWGWHENPFVMNPDIYDVMSTYRQYYNSSMSQFMEAYTFESKDNTHDKWLTVDFPSASLAPSLFNPFYGVQHIGITHNTPLVDIDFNGLNYSTDWTDCSIRTLVKLSAQKETSELGQARYRYSDFMYCKDLGMPNNRMITLRRFATPVGDNIFGLESTASSNDNGVYSVPGDVGRLVGYFDTDENRLEDIINYSFHGTWKEVEAEWQQLHSQEDDRVSPVGMLLNTMSADYRKNFESSIAGDNNLISQWLGGKLNFKTQEWYKGNVALTNYDKNKVYEPINTIRNNHLYEGKLDFNQEINLTFVYTLRSYDILNPKAAMLDLLGNIVNVTYHRGTFWGGRQQIIGPQPNTAGWREADNIVNNAFDKVGGIFAAAYDAGTNAPNWWGGLASAMQSFGQAAFGSLKDMAAAAMNWAKENVNAKTVANAGSSLFDMVKGLTKNTLGRPQLYAFHSLVTGRDQGFWHLTIGNPRNPIAVMGNLILKDARITHFGPLGLDDFPTGLKVTVTLAPARSRDAVDIQKMYTRGTMAMHVPLIVSSQQKDKNGNPVPGKPEVTDGNFGKHLLHDNEAGVMYSGDFSGERAKRNVEEIQ